jgi:hypothetical protein
VEVRAGPEVLPLDAVRDVLAQIDDVDVDSIPDRGLN